MSARGRVRLRATLLYNDTAGMSSQCSANKHQSCLGLPASWLWTKYIVLGLCCGSALHHFRIRRIKAWTAIVASGHASKRLELLITSLSGVLTCRTLRCKLYYEQTTAAQTMLQVPCFDRI